MESIANFFLEAIIVLLLCLPRVLVTFHFLPIFMFSQLPFSLKSAIAVGITLPISANLINIIDIDSINFFLLFTLVLKESIIGLLLGFVLAIPFWIFQSMGALIDNQRGALSAGYLNPESGPDASMLGDLFNKVLVVIFIQVGIFSSMFELLISSYQIWPPTAGFPEMPENGYHILIEKFSYLIKMFVLYAGPVILVLLLVESAFAILGAYSPQLQVYFMAMPAKSLSALIIIVFYFHHLINHGYIEYENLLNNNDLMKLILGNY